MGFEISWRDAYLTGVGWTIKFRAFDSLGTKGMALVERQINPTGIKNLESGITKKPIRGGAHLFHEHFC